MADDVTDDQIGLEGPGSTAAPELERPGSPRRQQHDQYRPNLGEADLDPEMMKDEDDTDGSV